MSLPSIPVIIVQNNFVEKARYFPQNKTYDVTDFVTGGSYVNILHELERIYNFSTKIYTKNDNKWGIPYTLPNGKIALQEGIVKDLVEGPAEIIVNSLAILPTRSLVIDYLPGINEDYTSIFIPKSDDEEGLDLTVYYVPFSSELWFAIFAVAFIMGLFFYTMEWLKNESVSSNIQCTVTQQIFISNIRC